MLALHEDAISLLHFVLHHIYLGMCKQREGRSREVHKGSMRLSLTLFYITYT